MNIVLTRPAPRNQELLELFSAQGLVAMDLPALELEEQDHALDNNFDINDYDAIFFVSRLAAQLFIKNWQKICKQNNKETKWPVDTLACAVGFSSAKPLMDCGLIPNELIIYPSQEQLNQDSEALWDILENKVSSEFIQQSSIDIKNTDESNKSAIGYISKIDSSYLNNLKKALIIRGQTGREWLSNKLSSRAVHVDKVAIYNRKKAVWNTDDVQTLANMLNNTQQATVFLLTSSESLSSVYNNIVDNNLLDKWSNCIFVCVHHRIATALQAILSGCQTENNPKVLISSPTNQDIYETILSLAH